MWYYYTPVKDRCYMWSQWWAGKRFAIMRSAVHKNHLVRSRSHFKVKCVKTACLVHNSFISCNGLIKLDTNVQHHETMCSEQWLCGLGQGHSSNVIKLLVLSITPLLVMLLNFTQMCSRGAMIQSNAPKTGFVRRRGGILFC